VSALMGIARKFSAEASELNNKHGEGVPIQSRKEKKKKEKKMNILTNATSKKAIPS